MSFYCWLKRAPSITWLLMKSGNSLSSDCFVLPTHLEWMLRGKYLCRSRGAIFRSHSYFGFHCSEFSPWGSRSYLCTTPDDFSLFFSVFSVPELPARRHTPRTSVQSLNKLCVVPGNCVGHPVLTICWRSKGLFWTCVLFQEFVSPGH